MSSAAPGGGKPSVSPPSSSSHSSFLQNLSNLGLGYSIAIALGFLVLLSTLLLVSYVCCRPSRGRRPGATSPNPDPGVTGPANGSEGLPRIIFVTEDDDDDEEAAGRSPVPGLDQAAINSYPKFPFSKNGKAAGGGDGVCAVCLCEYREGEMLRMMPDCRHCFHLTCVDAWLRLNASCPVCRTSPMPTPLSTPLSELVPLSHYAADRRRR